MNGSEAQKSDSAVMDDLDQRIVGLLREDGRSNFKDLAVRLGISENLLRVRVRRMEEQQYLKIVAITDYEALGYRLMLAMGIQVEGRAAEDVALALAEFPEVFSLCEVVGRLNIECLLVARDQQHIVSLLAAISRVPGVRKLESAIALQVLKNQPHWVPFDRLYSSIAIAEASIENTFGKNQLDTTDRHIVGILAEDARISNRKIAAELGVSEGTVRGRLKRMADQGQVCFTAISNIGLLRKPTLAYIWVEVERSDRIDGVLAALAAEPQIGFVGNMLGRFDILAITLVQDNAELAQFLHSRVSCIAGVQSIECALGVNFLKHDYRMSRIVSPRSDARHKYNNA